MKTHWAIGCSAVALVAGMAIGWSQKSAVATIELSRVDAGHQLEVAGLCAATLGVLEENDPARVQKILNKRLESAVERLYGLPGQAFEFPEPIRIPNLRNGFERAVGYLEESHSQYAQRAAEVRERLSRAKKTS